MLDVGAHINAVTAKTFRTLGLEPKISKERIIGVIQIDSMPVEGSLKHEIIPKRGENMTLNCVVLKTITAKENPNQPISASDYKDSVNYNLADDQFWQPGEIDILLVIIASTQIIKRRILKKFFMPHRNYARLENFKPSDNSNPICLLDNETSSFA